MMTSQANALSEMMVIESSDEDNEHKVDQDNDKFDKHKHSDERDDEHDDELDEEHDYKHKDKNVMMDMVMSMSMMIMGMVIVPLIQ